MLNFYFRIFSFIFVKFKLLSFHDTPYIYLQKNIIPLSHWRTEEHEWGHGINLTIQLYIKKNALVSVILLTKLEQEIVVLKT